jgi:hypothetical protein
MEMKPEWGLGDRCRALLRYSPFASTFCMVTSSASSHRLESPLSIALREAFHFFFNNFTDLSRASQCSKELRTVDSWPVISGRDCRLLSLFRVAFPPTQIPMAEFPNHH